MLTLIHGDNIVLSRNELTRIKNTAVGKEIRDINGKNISESDLRQSVESLSLFGNTVLIVIENLFSPLGRKEKQVALVSEIISTASNMVDIVIWEPKEVGKTVLNGVKKAKVQLYKISSTLFDFLDSLAPHQHAHILALFEKTLDGSPVELILFMLGSRVRHLIQVKDNVMPDKMSPWQSMRLTNQAKSFTMDKLLAMHNTLIELEYLFKTGSTPFTLTQLITHFIMDI